MPTPLKDSACHSFRWVFMTFCSYNSLIPLSFPGFAVALIH